jgi:hypothetical protein
MNLNRRLAVLFVILALGGCAEPAPGRSQAPYAPYSHQSGAEDVRSGMDGAGGGGGGM